MPFSFKAAPGVRIRASGTGLRTSIDVAGTGARCPNASRQALAEAEQHLRAGRLQPALDQLRNLHRREFPPARAPEAPPPPEVNAASVVVRHRKRALTGLGPFQRTLRRQALADARTAADHEIRQLEIERHHLYRHLQQRLDRGWQRLLHNEPSAVLSALTEAFDDHEAPAAAVGVIGAEVSLVTAVPGVGALRGCHRATAIASHVLLTVRETFAVAPGLRSARVVALQHAGGPPRVAPTLAARLERARLSGVPWHRANALEILRESASELLTGTATLAPLDLVGEPHLAAFLATVRAD